MTLALRPNEYVKYEAHFSFKVFVFPMFLLSIGIMVLLAVWSGVATGLHVRWLGYYIALPTLLMLLGCTLFTPYFYRRVDNRLKIYAITNQRVYVRRGIINILEKDIPLAKINDVQISQSIAQRLFNAGDVIIQVGNDDSSMIIDDINRPRDFRDIIISAIYDANIEQSAAVKKSQEQRQQQNKYNQQPNQQGYDQQQYNQGYNNNQDYNNNNQGYENDYNNEEKNREDYPDYKNY